jgi:glycosyltransferase involved in cell wall biosynthesis
MKIVLIGSAHPLRGGLATFNEILAGLLQAQGHEVVIYSFSLQYPSFLFPGKTQYTDAPAPQHLRIRSVVNSINPFNWISRGRMIRKERPDLILVKFWLPFMGPCFGTLLRLGKKTGQTKVISILDNVIPHEKRPGDRMFTRYFLKPVDGFISMSREVLQDLKLFTDKPASYTPHPVYDNYGEKIPAEAALRHLNLDGNRKYLLFFGFIRRYKGLDILLEAMNDPWIRAQDIRLVVAGEFYDEESHYRDIISKYGLQDKVLLYTDYIPDAEVKYYFGAADLVVQPYRTATQSGITQIAYHFEKPMVVTNVGGLAETVPDGQVGFVAEPDAASIAAAIRKFYEPGALPDFAEAVRREKQKYTWDTFLERLLDLYKELK